MDDDEAIKRFLEWFGKNGGSFHPAVNIIRDTEHGVHVRALEDLTCANGDVAICKSPSGLSLSSLNVREVRKELGDGLFSPAPSVGSVIPALLGYVDATVISHFVLLEQRSLEETSYWHPYIRLLPKPDAMTTPLYFDSDDLAWLLGTNMHAAPGNSAVETRRGPRRQEWEAALVLLRGHQLDRANFTFEWYLWAATIFTSRAFSSSAVFGQSNSAFAILYPGIDFLNHSPEAKVAWDFNQGTFTLSSSQRIGRGEEVYNNYAPKGNEELLMGYGFAIADNPTDTVRIVLPRPPAPVHENLKRALPNHFKSDTWDVEEASFELRSSSHYAGSYGHGIACLSGVPYAMFRMMAELVYFMSTQELDGASDALEDADFFMFVIEQFLNPLRSKRAAIPMMKEEPSNQKQRYAKIYRDGQTKILEQVIKELEMFLAGGERASMETS